MMMISFRGTPAISCLGPDVTAKFSHAGVIPGSNLPAVLIIFFSIYVDAWIRIQNKYYIPH